MLGAAREDPDRWAWLAPRLRIAALLNHPAAIGVLDLALDHDPPYLVRPSVSEDTLAKVILSGGVLPEPEALRVAAPLAAAVTAAQSLGLVHGRIVPGRVRLDETGFPRLDFTGVEVLAPGGDASMRTLDASCEAPEIAAGSAPGRACGRLWPGRGPRLLPSRTDLAGS